MVALYREKVYYARAIPNQKKTGCCAVGRTMGKTGQEGVHNMKKWEEKSKMKVAWRRENQGLLALKSSKMLELREASTFLQEMNEILP